MFLLDQNNAVGIGFDANSQTTFTVGVHTMPAAYGFIPASETTCENVAGAYRVWIAAGKGPNLTIYECSAGQCGYAGTGGYLYLFGAQVDAVDATWDGPAYYIPTDSDPVYTLHSDQILAINGGNGPTPLTYREQVFPTDATNFTIEGYGAQMPLIAGDDVIPAPAWTNTSDTTYQATVNIDISPYDSGDFTVLFENETPLAAASSLANCEAKPGTYWISALTNGPQTMYVNPTSATDPATNGNVYEYSARSKAIFGEFVQHNTYTYLQTRRALNNDGSFSVGDYSTVSSVTAWDGTKHNIYVGTGSNVTNANAMYEYYGGSLTSALFVLNTNVGKNEGATFTNISGVGQRTVVDSASSSLGLAQGILAHVNTSGNFGAVTVNGAKFSNVNLGIEFANTSTLNISNLTMNACAYGVQPTGATNISNSTIDCGLRGGSAFQPISPDTVSTILNSTLSGGPAGQGVVNCSVYACNVTLTNDTITTSNGAIAGLAYALGGSSFTSSGTTFDLSTGTDAYYLLSTPALLNSNGNRFQNLSNTTTNAFSVSGTNYTLTTIRSALGQETTSTQP